MTTRAKPDSRTIVIGASEVIAGIHELGIRSGDRLFVHSSLSAFGHVEDGAETVCRALLDAVGPEGTVAAPTFTWRNNHERTTVRFDVLRDACETGAIPEAFRKIPGALRSDHVCHSLAAHGADAKEVMGDGVLSFGRGSGMYSLYDLGFHCVFLGCGFAPCTALHVAEELMQVPYRYYRHYDGSVVVRADGTEVPSKAREFLPYIPFSNNFRKMEAILEERGLLRRGQIGNATVIATSAREIIDTAVEYLEKDIGFLLSDPSRVYLRNWRGPLA
jgi:aminoglycoside 3-N-acetyltransferase